MSKKKKIYSLIDLLYKVEKLDGAKLGGPLRHIFWLLVRKKMSSMDDWDKAMYKLTHDPRFCEQESYRRRELRDRITYSLVKGCPDLTKDVTELSWNRFITGLCLLGVETCSFSVKCKRVRKHKVIEYENTVPFDPVSLSLTKKRSDEDASRGITTRLVKYIKNPEIPLAEMNHPLGLFYWKFVTDFKVSTPELWNKLMGKFLTNPTNCLQMGNYRTDLYSNLKKGLCNTENTTWRNLFRGLLALSIDVVELTVTITDGDDITHTETLSVDMKELKFIQLNSE